MTITYGKVVTQNSNDC